MNNIKWLDEDIILVLHEDMISSFGGFHGVRDINLLNSAIHSPKNSCHYNNSSLFELAATYCFSIVKNHPFNDGNKRTAFVATLLFLELNGIIIDIDESIALNMMIGVASSKIGVIEVAVILEKFRV
jgi:death-on-curing protein